MSPSPKSPPNKGKLTPADSSKGAKAAAEVKRKKRTMREVFNSVLKAPIREGDLDEIKCIADTKGLNITVDEAIALQMVKKAIKGDVQAAVFVRDTSGNKPKDEIEHSFADSEVNTAIEDYFKAKKKTKKSKG